MTTGKGFGHPYKPYEIQIQFMEALYDALEHKKIGIFESPTGKSQSLSYLGLYVLTIARHQAP